MIQRYGIVRHPLGGFAAVYYEVVQDHPPVAPLDAKRFGTIDDALAFADENKLGVPVRIWVEGHPSYVPPIDVPIEREAASYLRSISREFWDVVNERPLSEERLTRVTDRLAEAGFDTPEMAQLVSEWLDDAADRRDATKSGTAARSDVPGRIAEAILTAASAVDGEDDDAATPSRNHLSPVPDPESEPGRTVTHAQMVEALTVLGLSTRYVQALGLRDDGIWVHSIMPGKSGGRLVGHLGSWIDRIYVEYIKVTDVPEDDL